MIEHPYQLQSAPAPASLLHAVASKPVTPDRMDASEALPTQTHVLVLDDHAVARIGIAYSLLAFTDLVVVAQASTGEEALRWCADADVPPDIVLMDLMRPGMGGIAIIQALHTAYPHMQIVVLTSNAESGLVEDALQAGAISYLLKNVEVQELAKAVRMAHQGMPVLAPEAIQALVDTVVRRPPQVGHDLTKREREVLELVARGWSNQQIAEQLVVTPATIKFHARNIRSKLGTTNRTETVVLALQCHLVPTSVQGAREK